MRRRRWERDPSTVPTVDPTLPTVLPPSPEPEAGLPHFIDKKNEPRVQGTCLGGDILGTQQEFIC